MKYTLPITLDVFEENEYVIVECREFSIAVQGRNLPIAMKRFGKTWEAYQILEMNPEKGES